MVSYQQVVYEKHSIIGGGHTIVPSCLMISTSADLLELTTGKQKERLRISRISCVKNNTVKTKLPT